MFGVWEYETNQQILFTAGDTFYFSITVLTMFREDKYTNVFFPFMLLYIFSKKHTLIESEKIVLK